MSIPFNSTCFGLVVKLNASDETGEITAFASNKRFKQKQFFVEYVAADGRFVTDWFFEDQLHQV